VRARARSWLHANCAACHRFSGGGAGSFQLNLEVPLERSGLVGATPVQGSLGLDEPRLLAPGVPERSVLLHRLAKSGSGQMPPLGRRFADPDGVRVVARWIESLEPGVERPSLPLSHPGGALRLLSKLEPGTQRKSVAERAGELPPGEARALLRAYLPEPEGGGRLGPTPDGGAILALTGRAEAGRAIYLENGCAACHRIGGEGGELGPDLSRIGARLTREQLLESLLDPSRTLAPGFAMHRIGTEDGDEWLGRLVEESEERLVLQLADLSRVELESRRVASRERLPTSLMPAGLLQDRTAAEAADLLAFLASLGVDMRDSEAPAD